LLRFGIWNLKLAPDPARPRGHEMIALAQDCDADIWLFTEIHVDWRLPGYARAISGPRSTGPERKRWAGIACRDSFDMIIPPIDGSGPADEGLCMARLRPKGTDGPGLLVACSVLPWANTVDGWPSLHEPGRFDRFADRFRYVTDTHIEHMRREHQEGEILIWGGDFNESLSGRTLLSKAGRAILVDALDKLAVTALTTSARHLVDGVCSIDHVAVSTQSVESSQVRVVTRNDDPRQTSDHALYLVDVALKPTDVTGWP